MKNTKKCFNCGKFMGDASGHLCKQCTEVVDLKTEKMFQEEKCQELEDDIVALQEQIGNLTKRNKTLRTTLIVLVVFVCISAMMVSEIVYF